MALLTNQIKVLIQRMKLAGRQPYKILLSRGLRDALVMELGHTGLLRFKLKRTPDPFLGKPEKIADVSFEGLPIVVDDSLKEILIQAKPRRMSEEEPIPNIDWSKIGKVNRL